MKKRLIKCYLDTNILVSFQFEQSTFHQKAVSLFSELSQKNAAFFITPLTLDEFLLATTRSFRIFKQNVDFKMIRKIFKAILLLPNLEIISPPLSINEQLQIINLIHKFKLKPRDAYHLLTITSHKITHFATFDQDFDLVFKKKLVLPVKI